MTPRRSALAVSRTAALAVFIAASIEIASAANDLDSGMSLFNKGNLAGAATFLRRAASQTDPQNPMVHYYLANTLVKLNKVDQAMTEYYRCYKLDPGGATAPFCLQMLKPYLEKKGVSSKKDAAPTAPVSKPPAPPAPPAEKEPEVQLPTLPAIPPAPPENPTVTAFLEWSLYDQVAFLPDAMTRRDRAAEQLQQLEDLMKRIEPLVASCVPNQTAYGETEEHFRKRQEKGRARLASLLAPYKTELERRQKAVAEAEQIIAACSAAKAQLKMK